MKRNGSDDDSVLSPDVDPTARARPADAGAQQPDLAKTGLAFESRRGRPVDLTVLSVLAVLYTLYFAREFLLPIVFALLLSFLFSPVARWFALMLAKIVRPFQRASKTAEQMAAAAAAATGTDASPKKPAEVVVQGPSLASRVFGTTQRSVASVLEVLILLYFLPAAGDLFLQTLIKVLPHLVVFIES